MQLRRERRERGFTLIELLVVVTIVGLLAGIAVVQVHNTMWRAKMNRLKHDLRVMRDLIQQYKVDKKKYPESLQALVEDGYMRTIPEDPITESSETWIEVFRDDQLDLATDFGTATGFLPEDDLDAEDTGIVDVMSGATGVDIDGVPYEEY